MKTTHIANQLHFPVRAEILFCPLCFDNGVYCEMLINLPMIETM